MPSATDELLNLPPYGLPPEVKAAALLAAVPEQIAHHDEHCPPYARWLQHQGLDPHDPIEDLADVPFLPVGIFKRLFLSSRSPNRKSSACWRPAARRRRSPAAFRSTRRRGIGR